MSDWIRALDKMPEIDAQVLAWKPERERYEIVVYSQKSETHRLHIRRDGQWWDDGYQITHWMLLPEPPKSEEPR